MTATPDRPATTPEGAGLSDEATYCGAEMGETRSDECECPRCLTGLSERTEGAGEVALSEEITAAIADMLSCYDTVMNVAAEARDLSAAVERILARRAPSTAQADAVSDAHGWDWRELSRGALSAADLAYMEADGAPVQRVTMAITAYLWAMANRRPHPLGTAYPSLNDWRAEAARLLAARGQS